MTYPRENFSYNAAATRMGNGTFNWLTPKRIVLFGDGGTLDKSHQTVADIGLTPIAVSGLMPGLSITPTGFFKSLNVTFPALTGAKVVFAVIVDDATPISTAKLLFHISAMNDLPFVPNGADWYFMPDVRGWFRP